MPKNDHTKKGRGAINDILGGLSEILDKLGEAVDSAEQRFGAWESEDKPEEDKLEGVYGFSVKVGIGGKGPTVSSFGNIHRDESTGKSTVHEVREPLVDIFEEDDHTLIVAEMPGIGKDDISIEIEDDQMTLSAGRGKKKYRKQIQLPRPYRQDQVSVACNNGIVEIRCRD